MEILGKIKLIGETEVVGSAGTFKKRTLVVSTDEQYVQHVPIDFVQDKCAILDKYQVGQSVKVSVNVRGNEYNGKYYVSLQGWRIEADSPNAQPQQPQAPSYPAMNNNPTDVAQNSDNEEEDSDLPF